MCSIISKKDNAKWERAVLDKAVPLLAYVDTHTRFTEQEIVKPDGTTDGPLSKPDRYQNPPKVEFSDQVSRAELESRLARLFSPSKRAFHGLATSLTVDQPVDQITINTWAGDQSIGFRFTALCLALGIATTKKSQHGHTTLTFTPEFVSALPKMEITPVVPELKIHQLPSRR
jgi:hypothetical protein